MGIFKYSANNQYIHLGKIRMPCRNISANGHIVGRRNKGEVKWLRVSEWMSLALKEVDIENLGSFCRFCMCDMVVVVSFFMINLVKKFFILNQMVYNCRLPSAQLNMANSSWIVFASLLNQDPVVSWPTSISGRIVLLFWWLVVMVVLAMYTANLAAFLTSEYRG